MYHVVYTDQILLGWSDEGLEVIRGLVDAIVKACKHVGRADAEQVICNIPITTFNPELNHFFAGQEVEEGIDGVVICGRDCPVGLFPADWYLTQDMISQGGIWGWNHQQNRFQSARAMLCPIESGQAICVDSTMNPAWMMASIIHELAHYLLGDIPVWGVPGEYDDVRQKELAVIRLQLELLICIRDNGFWTGDSGELDDVIAVSSDEIAGYEQE